MYLGRKLGYQVPLLLQSMYQRGPSSQGPALHVCNYPLAASARGKNAPSKRHGTHVLVDGTRAIPPNARGQLNWPTGTD